MQTLAAVERGPKPSDLDRLIVWELTPELPKRVRLSKAEVGALMRAEKILEELREAIKISADEYIDTALDTATAMAAYHIEYVLEIHGGPQGRSSGPWIGAE